VTLTSTAATPGQELDVAAALGPLVARAAGRPAAALVSISLPVDALDPISLYALARPLGATLWLQPAEGLGLLAVGEAWAARQSHAARFGVVSVAWRRLLERAVTAPTETPRGVGPLLIGGFAFDPEPTGSPVWSGFAPAHLSLPALLLTTTPSGAWLTASPRRGPVRTATPSGEGRGPGLVPRAA